MEKWISTKDYTEDGPLLSPKWHVPVEEEISFANELLSLHFQSALDLLLKICQDKIHTDTGDLFLCLSTFPYFSCLEAWRILDYFFSMQIYFVRISLMLRSPGLGHLILGQMGSGKTASQTNSFTML